MSKHKVMKLINKNSKEEITEFPNYGKHDFGGYHYGYIIVTNDLKVLYFVVDQTSNDICYYAEVNFLDVTDKFDIVDVKEKYKLILT